MADLTATEMMIASNWGRKLNGSLSSWKATIPGGFDIEMPYTIVSQDSSGYYLIRDANGINWLTTREWVKDNPPKNPTSPDPYVSQRGDKTYTIPVSGSVGVSMSGRWIIVDEASSLPTVGGLDAAGGSSIEQPKASPKANSIVDDVADIGRRLKDLEKRRL